MVFFFLQKKNNNLLFMRANGPIRSAPRGLRIMQGGPKRVSKLN